MADLVGESRELGAPLSDRVECSAAEVMVMARHEHILTMGDFLRRRTMLAMLETADTLHRDPGVQRAARLLFGPGRTDAAMPADDSGTMSPDGPLASSDASRDSPSAVG